MQGNIPIFWYVYNPQRSKPTYRHPTEDSAIQEARRLARKHPNENFIVLRAVCVARSKCETSLSFYNGVEEYVY